MWREPAWDIVKRRLVSFPALLVLAVLYAALLPVIVVVAVVRDLFVRRRWITVRCALALGVNILFHVLGVVAFLVIPPRQYLAFEVWWARSVFGAAETLFGMRTRVTGLDALGEGPIILLSRHASILDVLLPYIHVAGRCRMHLRFVMKRELLWDPCIDLLGHREPSAFVRRGGSKHAPEIAAVGRLMNRLGTDGVVLFPEGTRFTKAKQERFLRSLARKDPESYEQAKTLRHVLPPHLGGVMEVLDRNPGADILFCAHTGLEGANHFKDLLSGALLDQEIEVHFWRCPFADVPTERSARIRWLYSWWHRIDEWISRRSPKAPPA